MVRTTASRRYGTRSTRTTAERVFAELPRTPVPKSNVPIIDHTIEHVTGKLSAIKLEVTKKKTQSSSRQTSKENIDPKRESDQAPTPVKTALNGTEAAKSKTDHALQTEEEPQHGEPETDLRSLTWDDVCPPGDRIDKIAEASYAEVYRVSNERGTSIIKVIRLESPIKAQTKAQVRSGLVDEEPHSEDDIQGELQISDWLADVPGFVVYKERYIVQGKASKQLLETHQLFQKKMKRQDPDRAQFYPSPSRYLDDTRFLVVELGDAGKALEDWELTSESQLWDIFFLEAIALARAEDIAMFEHRDLHEGNLCIKQASAPRKRDPLSDNAFGYSGLEITILDYGLSRAEDLSVEFAKPMAFDLERDLSLFTSTHAPQCRVYRQMRSFVLGHGRTCLPPDEHKTPYPQGVDGPLSWDAYVPFTNVLWLAYLYDYLIIHFAGEAKELSRFRKQTRELWRYLNPDAKETVPCFGSAADIVCFAVEAGWLREDQLMGAEHSFLEREDSIIISRALKEDHGDALRSSPRK